MKRKNNLYKQICNLENIIGAYNEVCKNTKNKKRVQNYRAYKCIYISRFYNDLKNRNYKVGPYNRFTIYEPKERKIVSQGMYDKIVNHLVSRYILYPAILPCLIEGNVASRKGYGTNKALDMVESFHRKCKINYGKYYILKCDISKFFASINKDILKEKLKRKIKDGEALKIVFDIIDSEEKGLGIGNMTSQILAIFYLNDLDHYIKEKLKIKYYVRYQDDFLLFHKSKTYLQECFKKISEFLDKEKLYLNNKSRLYSYKDNFMFLGRDKKRKYARYRDVRRRIKKRMYLYDSEKINLSSLTNSVICYRYLCEKNYKLICEKNVET